MPGHGYHVGIGLNAVDPRFYGGWDGALAACENDARDMAAIAAEMGFKKSKLLLTERATRRAVMATLRAAAAWCQPGDTCLFTYSGHGTRVPDRNGDEADGCDEAMVLFDGLLIDDEFKAITDGFRAGARFIMNSDSCHSANQARWMAAEFDVPREGIRAARWTATTAYWRGYATRHARMPVPAPSTGYGPEIISLNACRDDQTALDGPRNGAFTAALLSSWRDCADWPELRAMIESRTPVTQIPVLTGYGASEAFMRSKPFAP